MAGGIRRPHLPSQMRAWHAERLPLLHRCISRRSAGRAVLKSARTAAPPPRPRGQHVRLYTPRRSAAPRNDDRHGPQRGTGGCHTNIFGNSGKFVELEPGSPHLYNSVPWVGRRKSYYFDAPTLAERCGPRARAGPDSAADAFPGDAILRRKLQKNGESP